MKIGITGQTGFVGYHLYNSIKLIDKFELVEFHRDYYTKTNLLEEFVGNCDVIIHLASMNRHDSAEFLYEQNVSITKELIRAIEKRGVKPRVIFSSSIQEQNVDNLYGKSKRDSRRLLEEMATRINSSFTNVIIPNVYGPFCKAFYNSVIATFCHQLVCNEEPIVNSNASIGFLYVNNLVKELIKQSEKGNVGSNCVSIPFDFEIGLNDLLLKLKYFKYTYLENCQVPVLLDFNDINLFNTFRSYIDQDGFWPKQLVQHKDERGSFVETLKANIGGQVSFSTTNKNVTRGNHFHVRKIERFTVIKGLAKVEMRKIGSDKINIFILGGDLISYIDIPIWYTHNITNIGDEILYTQFWINEFYNENDSDTFYELV